MSDVTWRNWQRAWEANPGDQEALAHAIAGRRRAGLPVSGRMLSERILPSRLFNSVLRLRVWAQIPEGNIQELGRTPHTDNIQIPPHHAWWVQPESMLPFGVAAFDELAAITEELNARRIPGLVARRTHVTDEVLKRLSVCNHLTGGLRDRSTYRRRFDVYSVPMMPPEAIGGPNWAAARPCGVPQDAHRWADRPLIGEIPLSAQPFNLHSRPRRTGRGFVQQLPIRNPAHRRR